MKPSRIDQPYNSPRSRLSVFSLTSVLRSLTDSIIIDLKSERKGVEMRRRVFFGSHRIGGKK